MINIKNKIIARSFKLLVGSGDKLSINIAWPYKDVLYSGGF